MSTWASLYGSWESSLSEEQLDELTEVLEEKGVEVDINGDYSFNDSCGYGFFDDVDKMLSDFAKKHKLAGSYEIKGEDDDETSTIFVGTDDQVKRQNYFYLKKEVQEAQNLFDAFAEDVADGDLARWSIEREET